jgi:hypothetical protein
MGLVISLGLFMLKGDAISSRNELSDKGENGCGNKPIVSLEDEWLKGRRIGGRGDMN